MDPGEIEYAANYDFVHFRAGIILASVKLYEINGKERLFLDELFLDSRNKPLTINFIDGYPFGEMENRYKQNAIDFLCFEYFKDGFWVEIDIGGKFTIMERDTAK